MTPSLTVRAVTVIAAVTTAFMSVSGCSSTPSTRVASTTRPRSAAPDTPLRAPSNVPIRRLAVGEKPPQFVLFSFDGVGANAHFDSFLDAADRSGARFSALMTGLYFLTDAARNHYQAPGHEPGQAAIGFGGSKAEVKSEIAYLNRAWYAGHELGTHYVGHFCQGTSYPGQAWTSADWNHELDQFFSLMANWRANTGITDGPDLAFGSDAVRGGRTQCLEGSPATVFPALRKHSMTWDSSMAGDGPGISWPKKIGGIWEFPIPYVYSPPLRRRQTALDYNFWYTINGARNRPSDAPRIRRIVRETYRSMYDRAFAGNRAPIVIANHFNSWSGDAFNPATRDFMTDVCGRPETICATYSDVIAWMQAQDPAVLERLQEMPAVAVDARH
ncbi:hypothetical protein nbrc107696_41300 [Gordonia spumicola]|uniref:Polysaccharide deacetylase n=1 Tax=Gordonia spumicola TaxID=589161 RepID=A0A7I9VEF0_9ACTN|nr:polysaccharide deacetylase [Gordonia spumicola]GEE03684.1 hypothetical protein nbrc107696_41300 [Gordonia spumicola]